MQNIRINRKRTVMAHIMLAAAAVCVSMVMACFSAKAQDAKQWKELKAPINLFVANDLGRNGYYEQRPIADLMGVMAEEIGPEAVIAAGDVHHFNGVASVADPLWTSNYESIYSHPELMIDWLPVLGNHEYRGNTQAVLDYSQVSRRWVMPARYYTKVWQSHGTSLRLVMIDTTPLITKYRNDSITYPDACRQDAQVQLNWLDATLSNAHEDWVIVVGHHPVYAQTPKEAEERADMQRLVKPIIERYGNVDMYVCGHIHNFQHIVNTKGGIDYVVNSAGSLARKVSAIEGTVFCSPLSGFSVVAASKKSLILYMIDSKGNLLHTVKRSK